MAQHRFHGDPQRFEALADFTVSYFGKRIKFVADVAGGQGMLARQLNKNGYDCEVVDPRGWTLVGVKNRPEAYSATMADYYDLVIGLHPDQALRDVVESAKFSRVVVVPCCNFWNRDKKLGRDALLAEIEQYFSQEKISFKRIAFDFKGPQNIGFVTS